MNGDLRRLGFKFGIVFIIPDQHNGLTLSTQLSKATGRLAPIGGTAYAFHAVKQPFVNLEEKIDRFVGRRTNTPDAWKTGM